MPGTPDIILIGGLEVWGRLISLFVWFACIGPYLFIWHKVGLVEFGITSCVVCGLHFTHVYQEITEAVVVFTPPGSCSGTGSAAPTSKGGKMFAIVKSVFIYSYSSQRQDPNPPLYPGNPCLGFFRTTFLKINIIDSTPGSPIFRCYVR